MNQNPVFNKDTREYREVVEKAFFDYRKKSGALNETATTPEEYADQRARLLQNYNDAVFAARQQFPLAVI